MKHRSPSGKVSIGVHRPVRRDSRENLTQLVRSVNSGEHADLSDIQLDRGKNHSARNGGCRHCIKV